jgi:WD40 repeat protein
MAREPRSVRRVVEVEKLSGWKTRRGSVVLHVFGRVLACLIGAIFVAEALVVEQSPARDDDRMWLAKGEDGVETLSLEVSPQGALMATTDTAGRVSLWNEALGLIIRDIHVKEYATSAAFTPDGRFLAIAEPAFGIMVWPVDEDTAEQAETLPFGRVNAMAFSLDGRWLAAASASSSQIVIWDRAERRATLTLRSRWPILSLAFSPDGRYLAAGEQADTGSVYLWDVATGRARYVLSGTWGHVVSLAFSPEGAVLAAVGMRESGIRIWNMRSGQLCRVIAGHPRGTNSVAFSRDSRVLASAGNDGMVRIWSVASGDQLDTLDGRTFRLNRVAFSPDGHRVFATGSADNDIRIWELTRESDDPAENSVARAHGETSGHGCNSHQ